MKPWLVVFRTSWTQSQTRPAEQFEYEDEALDRATAFNKAQQDNSWNYEVAYVHSSKEKLRA